MKKIVIILAAFLSLTNLFAQDLKPTWELGYEWLFDNREYQSEYAIPQTIFGSRLEPQLGLEWSENNSINIGAEIFVSMGKENFFEQTLPLVYYNYSDSKFNLAAGIIPKSKMKGEYPTAFFSDSINYYQPIIQGCLASYTGRRGYVELGCSWVGLLSVDQREQFMIFSSAQFDKGLFTTGYYFNMMHYAMYKNSYGVVDNILGLYYIGMNVGKVGAVLDDLSFKIGVMAAMQRDRKYDTEEYPSGLYLDLSLQKWHIGIDNSLYVGGNLMPYYDGHENDYYGADLYYGDPFYRTSNIYNRLEVFWQAVNTARLNFKISSVFHFDGQVCDLQQIMKLTVKLGGDFGSKLRL